MSPPVESALFNRGGHIQRIVLYDLKGIANPESSPEAVGFFFLNPAD